MVPCGMRLTSPGRIRAESLLSPPTTPMTKPPALATSSASVRLAWLVFAAALLTQAPLIFNPGYFSHDELQWAAAANAVPSLPPPWFSWAAVDTYQYRPLTFNLWLWLSRHLFDAPYALHAICVAWGSANAALLCVLGQRLGVPARQAGAAALVFALGPYAALAHGWVGTLGDLIWFSAALAAGLLGSSRLPLPAIATGAAAATAIGLAGKEAALAIPGMLAVAWWFDRRPRWAMAMLASATIAALYLALRLEALMQPAPQGAQYTLGAAHVPLRWLEYPLFAPLLHVPETFATFAQGGRGPLAISALLWLAGLAALFRSGRRLFALALLGGTASLLPVLPLGASFNHYGYAWSAWMTLCFAAAWPALSTRWRLPIALLAVLTLAHGAMVMRLVHRVGTIQTTFSPALAQVLSARPAEAPPLRLRAADPTTHWIFQRLTHQIPSYDGVAIGDRVRLVGDDAPADRVIQPDGRLVPAPL
jgi:hypothetical protein